MSLRDESSSPQDAIVWLDALLAAHAKKDRGERKSGSDAFEIKVECDTTLTYSVDGVPASGQFGATYTIPKGAYVRVLGGVDTVASGGTLFTVQKAVPGKTYMTSLQTLVRDRGFRGTKPIALRSVERRVMPAA